MPRRRSTATEQGDLFAPDPAMPFGFAYQEDVIPPAEEQAVLRAFQDLPFQPFEFHGFLGRRRVVSFGWRYDFAGGQLRDSDAIPSFLLPLRERAACFAGVPADDLQQILINEYAPGAGIGWHRDRPMFQDVIAISLAGPGTLRLRREAVSGWERRSRAVHPRSAYLLRGPSRWEWQHSFAPAEHLRYSVTFRNFVTAEAAVHSADAV